MFAYILPLFLNLNGGWIVTVVTMNIAACWDVLLTGLTVGYHVGS